MQSQGANLRYRELHRERGGEKNATFRDEIPVKMHNQYLESQKKGRQDGKKTHTNSLEVASSSFFASNSAPLYFKSDQVGGCCYLSSTLYRRVTNERGRRKCPQRIGRPPGKNCHQSQPKFLRAGDGHGFFGGKHDPEGWIYFLITRGLALSGEREVEDLRNAGGEKLSGVFSEVKMVPSQIIPWYLGMEG